MTSLDDLPIRDDLRGLHALRRSAEAASRVALNVNENTHPVPEDVARGHRRVASPRRSPHDQPLPRSRVHRAAREPRRLPRPRGSSSAQTRSGRPTARTRSSSRSLQAFGGPGRSLLGFPPTYSMHSIIAAGTGTALDRPGGATPTSASRPRRSSREIERTSPDIVFLCAPNNPTGTPRRPRHDPRPPTTPPTASSSSTRRTRSSRRPARRAR